MVSLRDAVFLWGCAFAPLGAWSGRARQEGCGEECRAALLIFSRGYLGNLAAQIHHLIRKRFYHLIRKIILT